MSNLTETIQWPANVNKVDDQEDIVEALMNAATQALADRTQYLLARLSAYAADSGSANAYAVTLTLPLTGHIAGMPVRFKAANTNTAGSTLTVNELAAVPLVLADSSALSYGNIRKDGVYTAVYNGTAYVLLDPSERVGLMRMEYTIPAGYLERGGQLVSRTTYADLWGFANAKGLVVSESSWASSMWGLFGQGDGSTTFRIPDFRGEFERGLDSGRGVDPGWTGQGNRALGSWQADIIKNHVHSMQASNNLGADGIAEIGGAPVEGTLYTGNPTSGGGTETRPRNIALIPVIKW